LSIANVRDPRANGMELTCLCQHSFHGAMDSISSSVSEKKPRIEFFSTPFHHQKHTGEAKSCPFPLLLGLLYPQWTMNGTETGCLASNGLRQFAMVLIGFADPITSQSQVNPRVFTQNPKRSLPPYSPSSRERSSGTENVIGVLKNVFFN